MKKFLVFIVLSIIQLVAVAQSTCSDKLRQAQRNFDEGLLDNIPTMIDSCMKDGFTEEEKRTAYKLLIQTYLFSDESEKADEVMLNFLRELPSYQISATDLKEFINLYNTYQTEPLFKWEIESGVSYSLPSVAEYYSVGNLNSNNSSYSSKIGAQIGLNFTNKIIKDFDWVAGVNVTFYRMNYSNTQFNYSTLTADFANTTIGVPLSVKYSKKLGKIKVFAKAGFETTYLIIAKADFQRNFSNGDNPIVNTEDLMSIYNKIDVRPLLAAGITLKVLNRYELAPSIGIKLSSITSLDKDNAIRNNELLYKYTYSGDNIRQNFIFFNVAFVIPYYNPSKKK